VGDRINAGLFTQGLQPRGAGKRYRSIPSTQYEFLTADASDLGLCGQARERTRRPHHGKICMFARTYRKAEQERRFVITHLESAAGWEVRHEHDREVVRQVHYDDWHRVERARMAFDEEGRRLKRAGWTEL
jgi:hypothetical protein